MKITTKSYDQPKSAPLKTVCVPSEEYRKVTDCGKQDAEDKQAFPFRRHVRKELRTKLSDAVVPMDTFHACSSEAGLPASSFSTHQHQNQRCWLSHLKVNPFVTSIPSLLGTSAQSTSFDVLLLASLFILSSPSLHSSSSSLQH